MPSLSRKGLLLGGAAMSGALLTGALGWILLRPRAMPQGSGERVPGRSAILDRIEEIRTGWRAERACFYDAAADPGPGREQLDGRVKALEEIVRESPDGVEARVLLAEILWDVGASTRALAALEPVFSASPVPAAAHLLAARIRAGEVPLPGHLPAVRSPEWCDERRRERREALNRHLEALENGAAVEPRLHLEILSAFRTRNFDEVVRKVGALEADLKDEDETFRLLACVLLIDGRHPEAVEWYGRALAVRPRWAAALFERALTSQAWGRPSSARKDLELALAIDALHVPARLELAWHLLMDGNPTAAVREADRVLELRPGHAEALYLRGTAAMRAGRPAEAVADFTEAVEGEDGYAEAWNGRSEAHRLVRSFFNAKEDADAAIERRAGYGAAFRSRALARIELGEQRHALVDAEKAVELEPEMGESFAVLGHVHFAMKRYEAAVRDWERAIHLDPALAFTLRDVVARAKTLAGSGR